MSTQTIEKTVDQEIIDQALTYQEYVDLINERHQEGRTTNDDNREVMLNYTKLGMQRSSRWMKRGKIKPELARKIREFPRPMVWLVLTEGWCGDASQSLPFLFKMAGESDNITIRFLLRDEYPEIMDQFLTEGARSIPKLIALHADNLEVIGEWGPRPAIAQSEYMEARANPEIPNSEASKNLHLWYARDKGESLQDEFLELMDDWK